MANRCSAYFPDGLNLWPALRLRYGPADGSSANLDDPMRLFLPLLAGCLAVSAAPSWAGDYSITANEKAACTGDAMRLCAHTYPDQDRLLGCMRENAGELSNGCAVVFKAGLRRRHLL